MFTKLVSASLTCVIMSSSIVLAKSPSKSDEVSTVGKAVIVNKERHWRSSKLIGLTVYNVTNEKIGTIQDFVVDKNAGIDLVIIDVGSVMSMDERNLAVGYKLLKWVNTPVGVASPTSTSMPAARTWILETPKPDAPGVAREGQWYPDHAVLAATKSQLKNMRTFEY